MSLATQRAALVTRHLETLEALHPATITIAGTDYAGSAGAAAFESVLTAGGEMPVRVRTFVLRLAVLATQPAEGTPITDDTGGTWRVRRVSGSASDGCWRIEAMAPMERGR